jgi:hypothetical protein
MKLREYLPSLLAARRLARLDPARWATPRDTALPLTVTLTSIPSRLRSVQLTLRSLLEQSRPPRRIVLWLHDDLRDRLPPGLLALCGATLEIRFGPLTCPHRKLIHALEALPQEVLVTCDDDVLYDPGWLERLYRDHLEFPRCIIAHRCRRIRRDAHGGWRPYREWPTLAEPGVEGPDLLPIGYGGVLYPPGSLAPQVQDRDTFLRLAPRADDLWFKAMSLLQGSCVRRSREPGPSPLPVIGSQQVSLLRTNVREDHNRLQWEALCRHFGLEERL